MHQPVMYIAGLAAMEVLAENTEEHPKTVVFTAFSSTQGLVAAHLQTGLVGAGVQKVVRVQQRRLLERYAAHCEYLSAKNEKVGGENERWLWHGTGTMPPEDVLLSEDGLDTRFSNGGFYGRGLYFAECSSKSDESRSRRKTYSNWKASM